MMISRSRSESLQQRHLKELLSEDQEPFLLTAYIADHKKCRSPDPQTLQLKKRSKRNASFPAHFCRNACFLSSVPVDSPDCFRKSPLLSPAALGSKSPSRAMFLHVPAKTAALLLDAACRIQRSSPGSSPKAKSKPRAGIGLIGSVIKRLTARSRPRKLEPGADEDVIRWADSVKRPAGAETRTGSDSGEKQKPDLAEDQTGFSNGRLSSVWSEENKSVASSSSSTSCSRSASGNLSEEEPEENQNDRKTAEDFTFCLSPLSPFRFALQKSPSPAICSPATSPSRRKFQDHVSCEQQDPSVQFQVEDEEEEKEQCSPVSILDPPFGDDDCEEEEGDCGDDNEAGFDMECSYAFVQRAKHHLLQKLRKFERLAELDPIELEKRMVEEQDEEEEELEYEADNDEEDDLSSSPDDFEGGIEGYLVEIARKSGLVVTPGMRRLLSDLISEEEKSESYECMVKRVCRRLESWKEVEPNTIEMMVAMDLKGEVGVWKKPVEETSQTAQELELSIFAALLEELLDELIAS